MNEVITISIQAKDKLGNNILIGGGSFVAYITGPPGGKELRHLCPLPFTPLRLSHQHFL